MQLAVADVRRAAKILVEREEIRTQSRMVAYDRVGSSVGASGMWVRRFVKGYEGSGLNFAVAQNILAFYDSVCTSVETNNERLRRDESHAATEGYSNQYLATSEMHSETASLLPPNEF